MLLLADLSKIYYNLCVCIGICNFGVFIIVFINSCLYVSFLSRSIDVHNLNSMLRNENVFELLIVGIVLQCSGRKKLKIIIKYMFNNEHYDLINAGKYGTKMCIFMWKLENGLKRHN